MEDHAQSGWSCELVVGSDDTKLREDELVELLVDTGVTEHVCGPQDFRHTLRVRVVHVPRSRPRLVSC